jgi:predicted dehydrogenase
MKIALIGCGYLGKIHVKCIKEIKNLELVGVYDIAQEVAQETAERFSTVAYTDMQDLITHCDVVDIVTATVAHFEVAKKSIIFGKHCFIEKPVTATVEESESLIALAQKHNVAVQVGHVERYNPAFLTALPHLTQPLSIEAFRLGKFNLRGADVSVVHDLMIHDIDLVLSLMKSDVIDIQAAGHQYLSQSLDIAHVSLQFAHGGVANLNASRIATYPVRKMCVFQPENYITVDFQKKKVEKIEFKSNQTDISEISVVEHNAIVAELADFIQSIQHQRTPKVTLNDGVNALRIADKVVKKILQ